MHFGLRKECKEKYMKAGIELQHLLEGGVWKGGQGPGEESGRGCFKNVLVNLYAQKDEQATLLFLLKKLYV